MIKLATSEDRDKPRRLGRPTLSDDELLDIALDLFLQNGFERTSIDAITAAAGMAKRTVYARYPDKISLFKAALTRAIENWIVPVERLRSVESADLEQSLVQIGQMLLANILTSDGLQLLRLSSAVAGHMPDIAAYNTQIGTEPTLAYLADLFCRRLLPAAAARHEADEAALAFLHLVVGGPASIAVYGRPLDATARERHTRYCVRLFLHGTLQARGDPAIEQENRHLRAVVEDAARELDRASLILKRAKSSTGQM